MVLEGRIRELIAAGDCRAAATEAIRGLGPNVLGYLRSILRDDEDAADAFSHFAEDLWRGIEGYRGEASFRTWAYKLAWCAAMHVRSNAWRRRGRRFEPGEASQLAEDIRTKSVVRDEQRRLALDRVRGSLDPEEQTLLFLRLDQELEWSEVAEVLSADGKVVEPAALRKRFERLKERIAQQLREEGLVAE
jgi:RNA polymerase sigma-70 factor (ECF subfamily)